MGLLLANIKDLKRLVDTVIYYNTLYKSVRSR